MIRKKWQKEFCYFVSLGSWTQTILNVYKEQDFVFMISISRLIRQKDTLQPDNVKLSGFMTTLCKQYIYVVLGTFFFFFYR